MKTSFKANRKRRIMACVLFILAFAFCGPAIAEEPAGDALLEMLPADCLVCVRINNLQGSIGQLDQYLAGASPVPVSLSMMATMQMAGVFGDPMLTGVNMQGTFAMAVHKLPGEESKELFAVFLVPLTDDQAFMKENKFLTPDPSGVFILAAPDSPLGELAVLPMAGQKYIAISQATSRDELLSFGKLIKDKKSSLAGKLDTETLKKAAAEPVWAYGDIAGLSQLYNEEIEEGLTEATESMAELSDTPFGKFQPHLKAILKFAKKAMAEADRLTVSVRPSAQLTSAEIEFKAKAGSEIAQMLVRDPMISDGVTLAGWLDEPAGAHVLGKFHKNCMRKLYYMYIDTLATVPEANLKPEDVDKVKSLISRGMRLMGDDVAYSFSYIAGKPPFELAEVVAVKDGAAFRKLFEESQTLPEVFTWGKMQYKPGIETYKNIPIDTLSLEMPWPDMPGQDPNLMAQTMGKSLEYYSACGTDKLFISAGPKAMEKLKAMIDRSDKPAGQATGDIATVLKTLGAGDKADMVVAVNIIRLVKGMSSMTNQMTAQFGQTMPDFWKDVDATTTSCLAMSSYLGDGSARLKFAMPKEHLAEVAKNFMQIQQKQMAYYQEKSAQMQQQPPTSPQAVPEAEPLTTLVGKAAPEMKMKDLSGKEISLSALKGKAVMLDFWATWCPPCKKQAPDIAELRKLYKEDQLAIIGVSDEPAEMLKKFSDENGINYTVVSWQAELPAPFDRVQAIPTAFFIDAEGIIRDVKSGYHDLDTLKAAVEKIVKK